jgi:tetratricopeptide (TPR) repeat protein
VISDNAVCENAVWQAPPKNITIVTSEANLFRDITSPGNHNLGIKKTSLEYCIQMRTSSLLACWIAAVGFALASQAEDVLRAAAAHIEGARLEQAETLLKRDLAQRGERAMTHYLLGVALGGQGKMQESDQHLHRALQLDQNLHLARRFLGVNAMERGDHQVARRHLESYLRLAPADETALLTLAQIELSANRLPEARARVLSIRSDDPIVLFNAGLVLAEARFFGDALKYFHNARAGHPDPLSVNYNLALVQFRLGDYRSAAATLSELAAQHPADAGVHSLLGDSQTIPRRPRPTIRQLWLPIRATSGCAPASPRC